MTADNDGKIEMLVLSDQEGNLYGIPRKDLQQHRLAGEELVEARRLLGVEDSVKGYTDETKLPPQDQTKGIVQPMPTDGSEITAAITVGDAMDLAALISQFVAAPAASPTVVGWMVSMAKNARIPI
jgi:hypothetical protein